MSYFAIKIIALITMFIDHLGYILLNNNESMRIIGRISFPLICFLLVNGYFHTKDKVKYLVRMTVFAFLSEPCFDFSSYMCVNMYKQNVFFTLVLGLLCLMATEKYIGTLVDKIKAIPQIISIPVGCISILSVFMFWNVMAGGNYGWYGILLIYLFYWTYGDSEINKTYMAIALAIANVMFAFVTGNFIQMYSILAIPVIALFKEKKLEVSKRTKIICYVFYPVHLLLLGLIRFIIM